MHRILLCRSTTIPFVSQPAQTEENGKTLINVTMFQHEFMQIQKTADMNAVSWAPLGICRK